MRLAGLMLAALALGGCPRVEIAALPETESAEPEVRVGLGLPAADVAVGGGGPLLIAGRDGGGLVEIPAGSTGVVAGNGTAVWARVGGVQTSAATALTIRSADTTGTVRVNGRDYRGDVMVTPSPAGLLVVNLVSLEAYVAGVVNAEMGRRGPQDLAALHAQAVISRTVAMRALGRYRVRGYDLINTIADQAYAGVGSETELGWEAVRSTRGEVLTYNGAVIEAFFHSTCAGQTEDVESVFSGGPQAYLRAIDDRDPDGRPYCAISPRYRWREEWTGPALQDLLHRQAVGGASRTAPSPTDVRIATRSGTGRVTGLAFAASGAGPSVAGQNAVRQALRLSDGGWLRSTRFTLQASRTGGRLVRLVAEGGGNGHGVGMCQWGALGRARAGASYQDILSAYFPGTELRRLF
ncbi:MAG: SpoIID/LytB domain-containing protein [Gemmatimonadales bacterium]